MLINGEEKEALSVSRLINEVLEKQLGIPIRNIVNDTTFASYTGSKRPDILISNVEYDPVGKNDTEYIDNLLCYAEAKDTSCVIGDHGWQDAYNQGVVKAPRLKMPFFAITNCHTTLFYNTYTGNQLRVNGNLISEFQTLDVLRVIKRRLSDNPAEDNIRIGVDSLSSISEAVFNKKLWSLNRTNMHPGLDSDHDPEVYNVEAILPQVL